MSRHDEEIPEIYEDNNCILCCDKDDHIIEKSSEAIWNFQDICGDDIAVRAGASFGSTEAEQLRNFRILHDIVEVVGTQICESLYERYAKSSEAISLIRIAIIEIYSGEWLIRTGRKRDGKELRAVGEKRLQRYTKEAARLHPDIEPEWLLPKYDQEEIAERDRRWNEMVESHLREDAGDGM